MLGAIGLLLLHKFSFMLFLLGHIDLKAARVEGD